MIGILDNELLNCRDPEKLRVALVEKETLLKDIVGEIPYKFFSRSNFPSKEKIEQVRDLISTRHYILDKMFRATDEDV